jgi:nucleoside-diphosphate-sugar epimerase
VHARDLAEGLVDAALSPAAADQVLYLSHPATQTMGEVLKAAGEALGVQAEALPVPDGLVRLLGALTEGAARVLGKPVMFSRDKALEMTQRAWCCSPAKAERLIGWKARIGLEEGMRSTMAWYRESGLIGTLT